MGHMLLRVMFCGVDAALALSVSTVKYSFDVVTVISALASVTQPYMFDT